MLGALAVAAVSAQADMKIVAKTTVSTRRGPQVETIIFFLKGSMVRVDDKDVTEITDSKTGKSIFINNTRKAYIIQTTSDQQKAIQKSIKNQHMQLTAHISSTGKHKTIAGHSATEYVGNLTVSGDYPEMQGSKAKAVIQLDEWTTPAKGVAVLQSDMFGTVGTLLKSLAGNGAMQQVTKELGKVKGVPLNIDVELTMTVFTAGGGAPQSTKHSYVTEAQFVTDTTLPASIFGIPKGYSKMGK